jgi:N-hydroxyarylamine O-acetyltransferase
MSEIPDDLLEAVLDRLGFERAPSPDEAGLAELYRRWCRSVPFDNTLKLIALHGDGPGSGTALPGMDAEEFLRSWLRHGTGGTCFPSANALHALTSGCGFDSRLVAGSMGDVGDPTHGTTVVTVEEREWLIDTSMLTDEPVRLSHETTTVLEHPVFATSAEPVQEGWLFQFSMPYAEMKMPCRTITPDAVDHPFFVGRFEISRNMGPFNAGPNARLNDDEGVVSYGGGKRFRRTAAMIEESDMALSEICTGLCAEFGLSEEIVDRLAAALAPEA